MHARTPVTVKRQLPDLFPFSVSRRRAWTFTLAAITPLSRFHANSASTPVPIDSCCCDMSANTTPRPSMHHCDRPTDASAVGGRNFFAQFDEVMEIKLLMSRYEFICWLDNKETPEHFKPHSFSFYFFHQTQSQFPT